MWSWAVWGVFLLLPACAGCLGEDAGDPSAGPPDPGQPTTAGPTVTRTLTMSTAGPASTDPGGPPTFRIHMVTNGCVGTCFEPMVAASGGVISVTQGNHGVIHQSRDEGATWDYVPLPPEVHPPGVFSSGDNTIGYAPWGEFFFMKIYMEAASAGVLVLSGLQLAISSDHGQTWDQNGFLSVPDGWQFVQADRPWLAFGLDTVYISVNTYPVGVLAPEPLDPTGIHVVRSDDHGRTWGPFVRVASHAQRGLVGQAGAPVVAPDGTVYLPLLHQDASPHRGMMARSEDRAETWTLDAMPGPDAVGRWLPQAAVVGDSIVMAWMADSTIYTSMPDGAVLAHHNGTVGPWVTAAPGGYDVVLLKPYRAPDGQVRSALYLERVDLQQGVVWPVEMIGFIDGEHGNTDFSHMTRLPDGRAVVVWSDADPAHIRIAVERTVGPPPDA